MFVKCQTRPCSEKNAVSVTAALRVWKIGYHPAMDGFVLELHPSGSSVKSC